LGVVSCGLKELKGDESLLTQITLKNLN